MFELITYLTGEAISLAWCTTIEVLACADAVINPPADKE